MGGFNFIIVLKFKPIPYLNAIILLALKPKIFKEDIWIYNHTRKNKYISRNIRFKTFKFSILKMKFEENTTDYWKHV